MAPRSSSLPAALASARLWVLFATLFVVGSGLPITALFARHLVDPCDGSLVRENRPRPARQGVAEVEADSSFSSFRVEVDHRVRRIGRRKQVIHRYEHARVVWQREDVPCACSDLALDWHGPTEQLRIVRERDSDVYRVRDRFGRELAGFRAVPGHGHRIHGDRIVGVGSLPFGILVLGGLGLLLARGRLRRAARYAGDVHQWTEARLRRRGFVEDRNGVVLATRDRSHWATGRDVLVDPAALATRDAYRQFPHLTSDAIVEGDHRRWQRATTLRLDDARVLATIAALSTFVALGAAILGA